MPRPTLLVDNHDSYTGNLLQQVWVATGREPVMQTNDAVDLDAVAAGAYSHIVLGPGPGTPHRPEDIGRGLEVLRRARVPVLGVCLGLQLMAVAAGGRVVAAPRPAHGRIERVRHDGSALFDGVPAVFDAVRYHSLVVAEPVGLRVTARAGGLVMAAELPELAWYGVQFHPESIGTPDGSRIVENFLRVPVPPASPTSRKGTEPANGSVVAADDVQVRAEHPLSRTGARV